MVDTSITYLRRSTHRSSVFEGQHIHLRRSTHRSSKVDTSISEGRHIVTSIFEGRHIDIRKLTHRSSKVDASIFEDRRRKHHTYNSSSNMAHNCAPKSLEWTKLHTLIRTCIKIRKWLEDRCHRINCRPEKLSRRQFLLGYSVALILRSDRIS